MPTNTNMEPKLGNLGNALTHRMNYLVARQGVVSGNIANASTPGYLARDIKFADTLNKQRLKLNTTHESHVFAEASPTSNIGPITFDATHIRHDGNSVKMDIEMLKLNDVQMNYRLMTRLYAKHASFQQMALGRQP